MPGGKSPHVADVARRAMGVGPLDLAQQTSWPRFGSGLALRVTRWPTVGESQPTSRRLTRRLIDLLNRSICQACCLTAEASSTLAIRVEFLFVRLCNPFQKICTGPV